MIIAKKSYKIYHICLLFGKIRYFLDAGTGMKKTIITLLVILLLGAIYYVTLGSSKLVEAMKKEVNHRVVTLEDNGFDISNRIIDKKTEHFVITAENPDAIQRYLAQHGIQTQLEYIQLFQDQKIGVDIEYLPNVSDAIAMDIYPLNLPRVIYEQSKPYDKTTIERFEQMINDKVFLIHIAINKLGNAFDGYIQDINQTFVIDGNQSSLLVENWTFKGTLNRYRINRVSQKLGLLNYILHDIASITLNSINLSLDTTVDTNKTIHYFAESMSITSKSNNEQSSLRLHGLNGTSMEQTSDHILNSRNKLDIDFIELSDKKKYQKIDHIAIDISLNNLNLNAIKQLQELDVLQNEDNQSIKRLIPLLKELTDANTSIDIHTISVTSITEDNQTYKGFDLSGHTQLDKQFNWDNLNSDHPMQLVSLINLRANLILSDKIVEMIAKDPKLIMFMMLMQPKDYNGSKIYELDYINGSLKINGKRLF